MGQPELVSKVCETYRAQLAMGGEAVEHRLATLVRAPGHPDVYDSNHVSGVRATTPEEIDEIFAACDAFFPAAVRYRQRTPSSASSFGQAISPALRSAAHVPFVASLSLLQTPRALRRFDFLPLSVEWICFVERTSQYATDSNNLPQTCSYR